MQRFFNKALDFITRHWWWFFIPVVMLTPSSGFLWLGAVVLYNPEAIIKVLSWDYSEDIIQAHLFQIYAQSLAVISILTFTTYFPVPFLLYLKSFRLKQKRYPENFIAKHWRWLFVPTLIWTAMSGLFFYVSILAYIAEKKYSIQTCHGLT
jgi:hypothetical protein